MIRRLVPFVCLMIMIYGLAQMLDLALNRSLISIDEPQYLNLAVTAASGRGLYMHALGIPQQQVMGGMGYALYTNALVVSLFEPSIHTLRMVTLSAFGLALIPTFFLFRNLYDAPTGWVAVALLPLTHLAQFTTTARPDSFVILFTMLGLYLVFAQRDQAHTPRHILIGLFWGLGLQVHLHTLASALAVGCLYLFLYLRTMRFNRQTFLRENPILGFVMGYALASFIYVLFNILPASDAFFAITTRSRGSVTVSNMLDKEIDRYIYFVDTLPLEAGVWLLAVGALLVHQGRVERAMLVLLLAIGATGALLLQTAGPKYTSHVLPILFLPIPPLITQGIFKERLRPWWPPVSFVVVALSLMASSWSYQFDRHEPAGQAPARQAAAIIEQFWPDDALLVGSMLNYEPFVQYERFISNSHNEYTYAMRVYDLDDEIMFWQRTRPEVVFVWETSVRTNALRDYVMHANFVQVFPNIWIHTCQLGFCPAGQAQYTPTIAETITAPPLETRHEVNLLAEDAVVLNPSRLIENQASLRTIGALGLMAGSSEWSAFLSVVDQMQFIDDLTLTPQQQAALAAWQQTKEATHLTDAGIDCLLASYPWMRFLSFAELETLSAAPHYTQLASWSLPDQDDYFRLICAN